ncbi:MAG TPA: hypothetical protein VJI46_05185 [Candidatus Nanoarchaeia archaeon]|nr:hypothetical protein [Candidatus Nanoarchaeia archaeon]
MPKKDEAKTTDDAVKTGPSNDAKKTAYIPYSSDYATPLTHYREWQELVKQDFTGMVDKSISVLPKSHMGGVLGFTYLGQGIMTLREDHAGFMRLDPLTQVHEAVHTPDEYETRRISEWMLIAVAKKYRC